MPPVPRGRRRPIDVVMLVGAYPPERSGGGLQCQTLVNALDEQIRFEILTTTRDRRLAGSGEIRRIPVHRVWVDPARPVSKLLAPAALLAQARRLLPTAAVLHIHGITQKTVLLAALARMSGTAILSKMTSVGQDDPLSLRASPGGVTLAWALRRADAHVSLSPAMSERFRLAGFASETVHFIPNGVDGRRFHPVDPAARTARRAELGLPLRGLVTTFVGFWSRDKAPDAAVHGWLAARPRLGEDARLVLLGATRPDHVEVDAALVARTRAAIAEAGAAAAVTFVEASDQVEAWLQASDLFVLASHREGLPNALLEAMATGLPCVVSALPGVTTWLVRDGKNGLLIPPGDADAIARALARLAGDRDAARRLGEAARVTVMEQCDLRAVAARYLALYRSLGAHPRT